MVMELRIFLLWWEEMPHKEATAKTQQTTECNKRSKLTDIQN